jgi:hypothetical protein
MKDPNTFLDGYERRYGIIPTAPDQPAAFVPNRYDFYLQAVVQGFCSNPNFSKYSCEELASLAIDQTTELMMAIDGVTVGGVVDDRPAPDGDSEELPW